jgi:hypothetical protein
MPGKSGEYLEGDASPKFLPTAMLGHPREMTNQTGSKFPSDEERRQKIAAERTLAAPPSVVFFSQPPAMQSQAIAAAVTVPAAGTLPQRESSEMFCFNSIQYTRLDLRVTELAGWQVVQGCHGPTRRSRRTREHCCCAPRLLSVAICSLASSTRRLERHSRKQTPNWKTTRQILSFTGCTSTKVQILTLRRLPGP